jgi:ketosteroid isomerase-like protein
VVVSGNFFNPQEMKDIPKFLGVIVVFFLSCSGNKNATTSGSSRTSNLEQEITNLDHDRIEALEKGDTAWLSKFYADDFTMITSTGEIRTKQDQLGDIGSGKVVHGKIEEKYLKMRFYGSVAVVQSESKGTLIQNGISSDDVRRFTRVFVKNNSRWQLVSTHISRVTIQSN